MAYFCVDIGAVVMLRFGVCASMSIKGWKSLRFEGFFLFAFPRVRARIPCNVALFAFTTFTGNLVMGSNREDYATF